VPDLLDILQQKGLADQVDLLEHAKSCHAQGSEGTEQTCLYDSVHTILAKACKANSWQGRTAGAPLSPSLYTLHATPQTLQRLHSHLSEQTLPRCSTAYVQISVDMCMQRFSSNVCPCVSCERILCVMPDSCYIFLCQAHIFMACPDAKA